MKRLDINYCWSGNHALYKRRLDRLVQGDLVVVTGAHNGNGGMNAPQDSDLIEHLVDIRQRGAEPYGYINTRGFIGGTYGPQGSLDLNGMFDQVLAWAHIYRVPRIFIDDWPDRWGSRILGAAWGMCRGYAKPDQPVLIVNPGKQITLTANPPSSCVVVTHENVTMPDRPPKGYEAAIVHHSRTPGDDKIRLMQQGWKYGFVTQDGDDGNPYDGDPGA